MNIASAVETMARQQPDRPAIYYPVRRGKNLTYRHLTYHQLLTTSDDIARGLEIYGLKRGIRAVLMVKPNLEFFALTFALVRAGIIPVIVDPGIGIKNLKTCLAEAQPEAFIGIPTAHAARVALGWAKDTLRLWVTVGKKWFWGGLTLEQVKRLGQSGQPYETVQTSPDETAAIIFTSGSTGIPKGVVYTHGNFAAQVDMLRNTFQMQPGEIDLPTFPVFALFDPALGMTTVIPEMDFTRPADVNPVRIIEAVERFQVTNMFGSPALLNRVSRYGMEHQICLPSLKRAVSAGAPVPAEVLERFSKMLPEDAHLYTPYGATEALPVSVIESREILTDTRYQTDRGAGTCVGYPVAGMEIFIIPITEEAIPQWDDSLPLPANQIGEIVVKGPTVTRAYFNREKLTRRAKIDDAAGNVYHRMGDTGYLDDRGRLWFCGRKSHRVETPQGTLFTDPVEGIFNTHPQVYRTALVGVKKNGKVTPVLCVELEKTASDPERILRELLQLGAQYPQTASIQTIVFHPHFPVDIRHNSKIFREKLAAGLA
ncbi:MAG: AMP-binding protein [Anaerolineae bacterium]|nr:AMP-binding protein [Anaerolineae bacterium]